MIDEPEGAPTEGRNGLSGEAARRAFIRRAGAAAAAPAVMLLLSAATTKAVAQSSYVLPGTPGTASPVECPAPTPPPVIYQPPVVTAPPPPPPPPPPVQYITRDRSTRAPLPGMSGAQKRKSLLDP